MLAFVKTRHWTQVDADAREAFDELVQHLGDRVEAIDLVDDEVADWHRTIMDAEIAVSLAHEWDRGRDRLSAGLRARIEHGHQVSAPDYLKAVARVPGLTAALRELFEQRYDAILTPAAAGTAPAGLGSTGEPTFNIMWTLCGMPALSVPLMTGASGLPLGVQLVGPRHGDARLLRTGRWLVEQVRRS
jgi:Asp-tRNA(Asn)/Glu-tRNA(Gln) amidotransferase A subunit family amidase